MSPFSEMEGVREALKENTSLNIQLFALENLD